VKHKGGNDIRVACVQNGVICVQNELEPILISGCCTIAANVEVFAMAGQ
jgi:hypothetical protein